MKVCPHCGGAYPVDEGFCPMDGTRLRTLHATQGASGVEADTTHEMLGRVLDRRYRLDEVIGQGAMGVVFRATHTLIGRSFAVKVLRREHLDSGEVAQRFLLEARVASSIKHPNVVDISDFGELPEGGAYYVMEMLEGKSLAHTIDTGGALSPADAGLVALQIANGLSAAHAMGVVHRDLKPDNVFLCAPRRGVAHSLVKLLDFGIARVGPRRITVAGSVLGTPEYMSPEMAQGQDVDHRADLYALGIILFEMLTATVPFYHKEIARTIEMHVRAPRPSLASRRPELASVPHVGELVLALMAVNREDRPSTADVVARTLAAALAHDLDREAADRVQRATLSIGSNLLQEVADPSRPASWPSSQPWPARPPAGARVTVPASSPAAPEPIVIAVPPAAPRALAPRRPAGSSVALAALGAAAVAGGLTFGVARWMRPDAPNDPIAPALDEPALGAMPVAGDATLAGTDAVGKPAAIAELPAPATPAVISAVPQDTPSPSTGSPSVGTDARPAGASERSKGRRRRSPSDDATTPTTPTTPGAHTDAPPPADPPETPKPKVDRVDPNPTSPGTSPADLKDPFPKK